MYDDDDVSLAPSAAAPSAPAPAPAQVEEEGEEAELQDEAAEEASSATAATSFSCSAWWPKRLRSLERVGHRRCLFGHRAGRLFLCLRRVLYHYEVCFLAPGHARNMFSDQRTCAQGGGGGDQKSAVHGVLPCRHWKESQSPDLQAPVV